MAVGGFDDPQTLKRWFGEQRACVTTYLQREGIVTGELDSDPAWSVPPYVSVWMVESPQLPGVIGWWAIAGDVPTDYISATEAATPREACEAFAKRWAEISKYLVVGEEHPTIKIGTPENRKQIGDVLGSRAKLLQSWTERDEVWS